MLNLSDSCGHAQFIYPQAEELVVPLEVTCVRIACTHGHLARNVNDVTSWWSKQANGRHWVFLKSVLLTDELIARTEVAGFLDFCQPIGLILNAVIHHLLDDQNPHDIVARYLEALVPGSYLQLRHFCDESAEARANSEVLTRSLGRGQVRSRPEIVSFFDWLDLVPPGVVLLPYWRPDVRVDSPPPAGSTLILVGVGRKP